MKPETYEMPASVFASKIGVEKIMPPAYDDVDNNKRLVSEFRVVRTAEDEATSSFQMR